MRKTLRHLRTGLLLALLLVTFSQAARASVWQYSVAMEPGTDRRAFLWVPEHSRHIKGVLLGLQNMLELDMFEDPEIRKACADADLAIVWISPGAFPGDVTPKPQPELRFEPATDAYHGVQKVLHDLAVESGFAELDNAPMIVTGHSAASPFVWGMGAVAPDRVMALLPYKGYTVGLVPSGIPTLYVSQEWAEWGAAWGEVWRKEFRNGIGLRERNAQFLFGDFADLGSGHFDWHHDSATVIGMFLRKAVQYRLTKGTPTGKLHAMQASDGVLVDPNTLGTTAFKALPYQQWTGDPRKAFWFFDREMAQTVQDYMLARLSKKPSAIDFIVDGRPAPLLTNGFAVIKPEFLADGVSFAVHADYLDKSPSATLFGGDALEHGNAPITYRVSSGALEQTGPNTFRVAARRGGMKRQGQPWEPWVMAYTPGDAAFRSADKPAHILVDITRTTGSEQQLHFAPLKDVQVGNTLIPLKATATSGLPVQFFVISGPVELDGNALRLRELPAGAHFPIHVVIGAYQWGRDGAEPVQSAGPVMQEFQLTK
jgi:hypothetical protein